MSVANTNLKTGPYETNGTTTVFPVTIQFFAPTEIAVYQRDIVEGDVTQLVLDSDYTVSGGDGETGSITTIGVVDGEVVPVAIAAGFELYILRAIPLTQPTDLTNSGRWLPEVYEAALDRLLEQIQQLQEQLDRCYKAPIGSTAEEFTGGANEAIVKTLYGDAQPDVVFGRWTAPASGYLDAMTLEAYSGAPVGQNLIARVRIDGDLHAQAFTLPAANYYAQVVPTLGTVAVAKGATVEFFFSQVGSPVNPGTNVTVTAKFRRAPLL